jgi:murein DD-endopeptidase MepM/ murein hydrolase activator NlpD
MSKANLMPVLLLYLLVKGLTAYAQEFDGTIAWPLCGRIIENPPAGWNEADGCPPERWGNPNHTDLPLSSTYGPRQKASEGYRYDYHRGLDIPTPEGTPMFAIADGLVKIAGNHSAYSDPLIQIRHYRPGYASCKPVGCYHSNYMHIQSWVVAANQKVSKGELIGYTGTSASGFEHLHFELRNAPAFDYYSRWQRDAIHPLRLLPYSDASTPAISFDSVDTSNPGAPIVEMTVTSERVDITRIELSVYDADNQIVQQPGNVADSRGYHVQPSWFDMEKFNFQYSHKNSRRYPWSSFSVDGVNQCPFAAAHDQFYDANVHLDAQTPIDSSVGEFNGITIAPARYNSNSNEYSLTLIFNELRGPVQCMKATVTFASDGGTATQWWGDCAQLH